MQRTARWRCESARSGSPAPTARALALAGLQVARATAPSAPVQGGEEQLSILRREYQRREDLQDLPFISRRADQHQGRPALTFRTAWATAQDTGLPPKVLKWRMRLPNASITSGPNSAPATQMAVARSPTVTMSGKPST
jgi:hypothetical protein